MKSNQIKQACLKSFQFFFEYFSELELTDFHRQLCIDIISNKNVLILSPRKSGKSTLMYYYVVWILLNNPDANILIVSSKFDGSKSCIRAIKYIILNHKFKEVFGDILDENKENTATSINVKRSKGNKSPHPSVVAASTNGGQIVGKRTSHIILDDIVTQDTCDKDDTEDLILLFERVILPTRLDKNVPIKAVATRWGLYDINQYLIDRRKDFTVKVYPAINEQGKSFCEALYSTEELMEIRDNVHPYNWSTQYMNDVACMRENAKFKDSDIHFFQYKDLPYKQNMEFHIGVDLAISLKEGADRFCLIVAGREKHGETVFIYDYFVGRLDFNKQVEVIVEYANKYNVSQINIESVAYQAAMAQHLQFKGYPAKKINPKGSKEERLMSLVPFFVGERILFPKNFTEFLHEYVSFGDPRVHDDTVDAVGLAVADLLEPPRKQGKLIHKHSTPTDMLNEFLDSRRI